jgi:hypothetical protein
MLKASFPAWKTETETIEMWHMMLKDLDGEIVLRATQDWILTDERFPTIAGIRKKSAEVAGALPISASEAWAEVQEVCTEIGTYGARPAWSNEAIAKTVKAIGYQHICHTENISTVRAQFIKMYTEFTQKEASEIVRSVGFALGAGSVSLPSLTVVKSNTQALSAPDESDYIDG